MAFYKRALQRSPCVGRCVNGTCQLDVGAVVCFVEDDLDKLREPDVNSAFGKLVAGDLAIVVDTEFVVRGDSIFFHLQSFNKSAASSAGFWVEFLIGEDDDGVYPFFSSETGVESCPLLLFVLCSIDVVAQSNA